MKGSRAGRQAATHQRAVQVVERRVGDGTYLIDCNNNTIHRLNTIGAALWGQLSEPKSTEDLVTALQIAFPDTGRPIIERDVADLVQELLDARLIFPVG